MHRVAWAVIALLGATACVGTTSEDFVVAGVETTEPVNNLAVPSTSALPGGPAAYATCVDALAPAEQVAQLLMVLVGSPSRASDVVSEGVVGGYGLVGNQADDVGDQLVSVSGVNATGIPLLVASDEEGGTVQRLRSVLGPYPAARDVASTMTPEEAGASYGQYASEVAALGINTIFGPVLDVGAGAGIGSRSYGDDVQTVTDYGTAVIDAIETQGVRPVAKHWPGLGTGTADSHVASASVSDLETLRARDLVPFQTAIDEGLPAILVSHAIVPGLTDGGPASLSSAAIGGELRGQQGFEGVVITDSLSMAAVTKGRTQPEAAVASIGAGADIALVEGTDTARSAHQALLTAVTDGTLAAANVEQSVGRVMAFKGVDPDTCEGPA
jgi:beta-N-acetylhexosaminidase